MTLLLHTARIPPHTHLPSPAIQQTVPNYLTTALFDLVSAIAIIGMPTVGYAYEYK